VIADYCTDRRSLVDRISADLSLLPKEKELIDREFDYFGVRSDTPIRFSVVDPVDISTRFDWTVDEERIDLLQLFFLIDQSGCEEENTSSMPSLPISLFPSQRDAFEVGILP
jgi:nicotinic acid phosphoribosyltransferase